MGKMFIEKEWLELMLEAKESGFTVEEIRDMIKRLQEAQSK